MITKLSRDDSYALLRSGRIGRLGCIAEGQPYVVPVNYVLDGDSVFSHSLPGRKIEAMRANPLICLQVDDIEDQRNWRSVIAYGAYEEITSPTERARVLNRLLSCGWTPVDSSIAEDAAAPTLIVFRLRIDRVTGISEGYRPCPPEREDLRGYRRKN